MDSREAALKGGENGVAIVPGKSAESRLIHFVARLVPDLEMPPEGKGMLTAEEVGVLRAWIDQAARPG
ncbi:MAG: c-type cytochrome domain-containing protein [Verrucomicrobiota bacterium]